MGIKGPTQRPPSTPTRANASALEAARREDRTGYSAITNSRVGDLQKRAKTSKTDKTGG